MGEGSIDITIYIRDVGFIYFIKNGREVFFSYRRLLEKLLVDYIVIILGF